MISSKARKFFQVLLVVKSLEGYQNMFLRALVTLRIGRYLLSVRQLMQSNTIKLGCQYAQINPTFFKR